MSAGEGGPRGRADSNSQPNSSAYATASSALRDNENFNSNWNSNSNSNSNANANFKANECGQDAAKLPIHHAANNNGREQPLILITESAAHQSKSPQSPQEAMQSGCQSKQAHEKQQDEQEEEGQFEVVDGIRYKLVAAVTKPPQNANQNSGKRQPSSTSTTTASKFCQPTGRHSFRHQVYRPNEAILEHEDDHESLESQQERGATPREKQERKLQLQLDRHDKNGQSSSSSHSIGARLNTMRRKSTALMTNLISSSSFATGSDGEQQQQQATVKPPRRLSIYEMTKSPPPETSLEIYLNERRRSSNISAKQVQQTNEQKSTFEVNYNQRQQYFKDLNAKLINQDKKLLNVVANRGQIHRHSVDIAQLPLSLALAKARGGVHQAAAAAAAVAAAAAATQASSLSPPLVDKDQSNSKAPSERPSIDQALSSQLLQIGPPQATGKRRSSRNRLFSRRSISVFSHSHWHSHRSHKVKEPQKIVRKFRKLDASELTASPAPDVKIGQRVAYKEYYGNEFGTIRWIGRVPQISPDWTVGVEFDNAIGEGDGSLSGRRYFIAKECFAKFLPLDSIALVDQHVGRPEPGTMISVMSAQSRPGQLISIQRVSTVHVQHCFLNAPHRRPGPEIPLLAVNTRLHCQCPNCGPCAHVIKPPRTQRLARPTKNATHMCQFSTYTCCGMQSQEETLCNYQGNKVTNGPVPPSMHGHQNAHSGSGQSPPPVGSSWMAGSGYLSTLQAQQMKSMPQEFKMAPPPSNSRSRGSTSSQYQHQNHANPKTNNPNTESRRHSTQAQSAIGTPPDALDLMGDVTQQFQGDLAPHFSALNVNNNQEEEEEEQPSFALPDDNENAVDDLIDSTLEADLERLSQARYGHSKSLSASSRRRLKKSRRQTHKQTASFEVLKMLKSLLSCLKLHAANRVGTHSTSSGNSFASDAPQEVASLPYWQHYVAPSLARGGCYDDLPTAIFSQQTGLAAAWPHQSENMNQEINNNNNNNNNENYSNLQPLSGSSDCGFSSGSQNSSPVKQQNERQSCIEEECEPFEEAHKSKTVAAASERELANRIYLSIAAKLIKSGGVSQEALERLGKVLDEGADSGHFEGPDQVIADIIGNVLTLLPNKS